MNDNGTAEQKRALKELMALDFKLYDLQLYLNTHPFDREFLEKYMDLADEAEEARAEYEEKYGPLKAVNAATNTEWTWIKNPWPWERMGE